MPKSSRREDRLYCRKCGAQNDDQAAVCGKCGAAVEKASLDVTTPTPEDQPAVQYAGFWRRLAAALIDGALLGVAWFYSSIAITYVYTLVIGIDHVDEVPNGVLAAILGISLGLALVLGWIYYASMESSTRQATWGKMTVGIIVTDMRGQRLSFGRASGRYLGRTVSALMFLTGYFIIAFTKKKQGLHDAMARCLVVVNERHLADDAPESAFSAPTEYPGLLRRLAAALTDAFLLFVLFLAIYLLAWFVYSGITGVNDSDQWSDMTKNGLYNLSRGLTLILGWLYYASMESSGRQATLGKMAVGILVTDTAGKRLSFRKAALRYFGRIVSAMMLGLGFVTIAFTKKQLCLHDVMADSVVLKK